MTWGLVVAGAGAVIGGYEANQGAKDAANTQVKGGNAAIAAQNAQYEQNRTDLAPYRETGGQALNSIASGLGLEGYYPTDKPLSYSDWLQSQGLQPTPVAGGGKDSSQSGLLGLTGTGDAINTIKSLFGKGPKKPKGGAPPVDTAALYQQYVKNYQAPEHAAPSTPLNDFNRDFTLADFQEDPGYQFRMDQGQRALESSANARTGVQNGATAKALERFGQDYASGEYSNAYNRFNADRAARFNRLATVAGIGQTATNTGIAAGENTANNVSDTIIGQANAAAAGRVGQANAVNQGLTTLGNYYLQRRYGGGQPVAPISRTVQPIYSDNTGYSGNAGAAWS